MRAVLTKPPIFSKQKFMTFFREEGKGEGTFPLYPLRPLPYPSMHLLGGSAPSQIGFP